MKTRILGSLVVLMSALAAFPGVAGEATARHTKDSLETVKAAIAAKKAVLVDVREKGEWEAGHLQNAILLPLSALQGAQDAAKVLPEGTVVYCHCAAGVRCLRAAEVLRKQGYDVRPLKAGYRDLVKAGFPQAGR